MANEILYAGQERRRSEAKGIKWLGLTLLSWTVGYGHGYRIFYSVGWLLGFIVIGAIVVRRDSAGQTKGMLWCLFYSFDMILPLVRLEKRNYEINLDNLARRYFYVHILIGYLLASFVLAGLSGLTK